MALQAVPLRLREFHAFPVLVPRLVLRAEANPPRLLGRALGVSDVRLELDGIGSGIRNRVDIRVGRAQAAVVRLRDLADDEASARLAEAFVAIPCQRDFSTSPGLAEARTLSWASVLTSRADVEKVVDRPPAAEVGPSPARF